MSDDMQTYQKKLQAKLDEWQADIDKLRAKAKVAEADAKAKYEEQIEQLKTHREKLESDLKGLQNAQSDAWNDMKAGVDKAWDDMSKAMQDAWKRFG